MPNIELTENLRNTIKELRKKKKKRGDELSKDLGKGASYISQVESGKIKEIGLDLLNDIFHKITDLSGEQYNDFIDDLLTNASTYMTSQELNREKWMHQFNVEIRQYPIPEKLISLINKTLAELNHSPEEFVEIINQNRGLNSTSQEPMEANKAYIDVSNTGDGSINIHTSIRFELSSDYISNILSRKTRTINYITMEGILYNLYLSLGYSTENALQEANKLLYENQFYTIRERNKLIHDTLLEKTKNNEDFTYYDIQPTDYDKQYTKVKDSIGRGFDVLRDRNIVYSCEKLEEFHKNMKDDLGFTIAIMSAPLYKIKPEDKRKFFEEYKNLVHKYINDVQTN